MAKLPGDVQNCLQAGSSNVSNSSNADFGNVSFFNFTTHSVQGVWWAGNWSGTHLRRLPPRLARCTPPMRKPPADVGYDAMGGAVWLVADNEYDLAASRHTFTLYLCRMSPAPDNLWAWYDHR